MISSFLGEEIFLAGVQRYLRAYLYGNASSSNLWQTLSDVSGQDVARLMNIWLKRPDHPVISIEEDNGTVTAIQHRFILGGSSTTLEDDFIWPLSLQPRIKHGRVKHMQMHSRTTTFQVSEDFFKINANQVGFFRVCYTAQRMQILAGNIQTGLLSVEDRIGLVFDAWSMASSGYRGSKTSDFLSFLEAFDKETNLFVWKQILMAAATVRDAWAFESEQVVASLKKFQLILFRDA